VAMDRVSRGDLRVKVAMLGPAQNVRGGVSAVVNCLLDSLPSDGPEVRYIATHVDGPKFVKALAAVAGGVRLVIGILCWRPQVVHLHMASYASFVRKSTLATIAHALRRRVIIHVHGAEFDVFFKGAAPLTKSAITRTLTRADLVIALSAGWRRRLARIAPKARIRVLPNPVPTSEFAPLAEGRPDAAPGGGNVLFLGAFSKRKGIYDLVEAMADVVRTRPDVVFELGGDQDVDEVERLVEQRDLSENVRMLGWVRGGEKLATFARAHVYVLPSYHEGLPIGVLEAMAAGLPVVTTPVGGLPEIVKDRVNGLLVAPGDVRALASAIVKLLDDADLRRRMGAANIELVRSRHDADLVARTLVSWYRGVSDREDI
jgi:glycosyltransferase involved in cell wall biosynthesis